MWNVISDSGEMKTIWKAAGAALVIALCFCCVEAGGQEPVERAALEERRQVLQETVARLKHEQEFLLFLKEMYAVDSKYLVLNAAEKKGQLRYKNRVLEDFRFRMVHFIGGQALQTGPLVLTKRTTGRNNRYILMFGTSLILRTARSAVSREEENIPVIVLREKDIRSAYSAIQEGARAYIY
jgi:hypothetical protein